MKIFYLDIEKFKSSHKKEFLEKYADIELRTEKRFYEYTVGRYLIKSVGENIFDISDTEIIKDKNNKPIFKNAPLHFSLSHSKDYIISAFDEFPCGVDIEYMKPRNLGKYSKYYGREFASLTDFYEFWTKKEAEYKLGTIPKGVYHNVFKDEYALCVVSDKGFDSVEIAEFE